MRDVEQEKSMEEVYDNVVYIVKNVQEKCVMFCVVDNVYTDTLKVTQVPYG